jgi:hypothetical protein
LVVAAAPAAWVISVATSSFAMKGVATLVLLITGASFPSAAFVAACATAAFDGYTPAFVVGSNLLLTDVLLAASAAGLLLSGRRAAVSPWIAGAAAALLGIALLHAGSIMGAAAYSTALEGVARFARLLFFTLMFTVVIGVIDARLARIGLGALVAGCVVRFIWEGIPYLAAGHTVFDPSYQFGMWTSNPNSLAGLTAPLLPVALWLAVRGERLIPRGVGLLGGPLLLAGCIFSYSKTAWVGCAIGATAFAPWIGPRIGLRKKWVGVGAAVFATAMVATPLRHVPAAMYERWISAATTYSNAERMRYVDHSVRLIVAHPVAGIGLAHFNDEYKGIVGSIGGPDDPHDLYLFLAVELGLPAVVLFLTFLACVAAARFERALRGDSMQAALAAATLAIAAIALLSSEPWASRVCWLILAWPLGRPGTIVSSAGGQPNV